MASFDSTKHSLYEILREVQSGKIQLPDFQRGWIWDDNRIKDLLASVAKSFPIGAIMLLETGNPAVKFKTKCIEGVKLSAPVKPDLLILDGQQRITSLFQSIINDEIVTTRNDIGYEIKRWYYIDMRKAMDNNCDLEEAIVSINEKKQVTSNIGRDIILDLSKEEYEFEQMMFPVCMLDEYNNWRSKFYRHWKHDSAKSEFYDAFEEKIIGSFNNYSLPIIKMYKENTKEAVCQVFEKVNTGGVSLTVFELLTATYASDDFDLKEDWESIEKGFKNNSGKVLHDIKNTEFIQSITLLATYYKRLEQIKQNKKPEDLPAISCKRKDILNLTLEEYKQHKDRVISGYKKAASILTEYHIYNARDLPYDTQLIPMSAILGVLGDKIENVGNKLKLMQWFWCGVFGELYGSANETRYALDLPQVIDYINNIGELPKTIYEANFSPSRLHTLRTRNSAAYKGVYALLLEDGTKDWLSATKIDQITYFSESIDIHHIFPVVWCKRNNISKNDYDCIVNKTPLSGRTNRIVSGDAPSKYLPRIRTHAGVNDDTFNEILATHVLDINQLSSDNFAGFFKDRKERILDRIERAMGKKINREVEEQPEGLFIDVPGDEDEE